MHGDACAGTSSKNSTTLLHTSPECFLDADADQEQTATTSSAAASARAEVVWANSTAQLAVLGGVVDQLRKAGPPASPRTNEVERTDGPNRVWVPRSAASGAALSLFCFLRSQGAAASFLSNHADAPPQPHREGGGGRGRGQGGRGTKSSGRFACMF